MHIIVSYVIKREHDNPFYLGYYPEVKIIK